MIPKYNELYNSVMKALSDRQTHTTREIADFVAKDMNIDTKERQTEVLSSGTPVFSNRVHWACTYLKKAGLLNSPSRGQLCLSAEGRKVFSSPPAVLDNHFLSQYPSFQEFRGRQTQTPADSQAADETPNDLIDRALVDLNKKLADDLMSEIMARDPSFFESLVVKLLLKMGYGGSVSDSGFTTQKSNDGGIDGIIREDKLGFDQIYIQAKRWDPDSTVGRPEIQKFSGALRDEGATKGLFITTAKFSDGARASADKQHIVLVDGARLTKLMIEYDLGVSTVTTYQIKTLDTDFFNEDNE